MPSLVSPAELKAQARLFADGTDEDAYLQTLVETAERSCVLFLDRPAEADALGEADLAIVKQAVLIWATALYEDRVGAGEVPTAVTALLRPLRSYER